MNKFIAKLGQDIPDKLGVTLLKGSQFSVADTIKDYAEQNNSDLLILGARSHGKFRNFIIGSTTESLIHLRPNIPILIKR